MYILSVFSIPFFASMSLIFPFSLSIYSFPFCSCFFLDVFFNALLSFCFHLAVFIPVLVLAVSLSLSLSPFLSLFLSLSLSSRSFYTAGSHRTRFALVFLFLPPTISMITFSSQSVSFFRIVFPLHCLSIVYSVCSLLLPHFVNICVAR